MKELEHRPHSSRRQRAFPSPHHPAAATQWYRLLLLAASGVRRTPNHALSMGMTQQFFLFGRSDIDIQTFPSQEPNTSSLYLAQIRSAVPEISE